MTPAMFDALRHATTHALVHFVWQGCVTWLIAVCLLHALRTATPQLRYAAYCGLLAILAVCPLITLAVIFERPMAPAATAEFAISAHTAATSSLAGEPQVAQPTWTSAIALVGPWLARHERWLLAAWLIGATAFAARLALAFFAVQAIKCRRQPLPARLLPAVDRTIAALDFHTRPAVCVVERLSQAMAVGFLRPMVLLPASWLSELPPGVLEAVITHELAHLRRWDLAINLLQRLVECVLFFHPVVWWCSKRLRVEREICCDALAMQLIQNRTSYAKALSYLADRQAVAAEPLVAAGIGGTKMVLFERIRQVLDPTVRKQSRFYGVSCAASGACAASIVWIAVVAMMRMPAADAPPAPQLTGTGVNSNAGITGQVMLDGYSQLTENQTARFMLGAGAPTEANKVTLPAYTIEPPDVLMIDVLRTVPKPPYHFRAADTDRVERAGVSDAERDRHDYLLAADGNLRLGPQPDDVVHVGGLVEQQALKAIRDKLCQLHGDVEFTVSLIQSSAIQPVAGEHLVGPDGNVTLGMYGQVYVAGLTLAEAKAKIDQHLGEFLDQPASSVSVFAYNSKVYYVITDDETEGDMVHRFPITGNETVLDALAQLKGAGDLARKRIWIARPKPGAVGQDAILGVRWQSITKGAATATNYQLLPGDRIFVTSDKNSAGAAQFKEWELGLSAKIPIGARRKASAAKNAAARAAAVPPAPYTQPATPSSSVPLAPGRY